MAISKTSLYYNCHKQNFTKLRMPQARNHYTKMTTKQKLLEYKGYNLDITIL